MKITVDGDRLTMEPVEVPAERVNRITDNYLKSFDPLPRSYMDTSRIKKREDYRKNQEKMGKMILEAYTHGYVDTMTALTPGVNILVPAYEAIAGKDIWGNKLGTTERVIAGTAATIPVVGKTVEKLAPLLRATPKGEEVATELKKSLQMAEKATTKKEAAEAVARFNKASEEAAKLLASEEGKTAARKVISLELLPEKSCFLGGTPLLTPTGSKSIEHFTPGDLVLSRDEYDIEGPVMAKVVEEVFVRLTKIILIHVGGRVIGTTGEHPFWVQSKGWLPARELIPGDRFVGHDGQEVVVEKVTDPDQWATVYNLRIADFHTYFVGCDEWGFSVWAHNTCYTVYPQSGGGFSVRFTEKPGAPTKWATDAKGDILKFAKEPEADAWVAAHKAASSTDFVGTLRGAQVTLPGVKTQKLTYTKIDEITANANRAAFDSKDRAAFLKSTANDPQKAAALSQAGLTNADIALMKAGKVPSGYQVHHKIPIDAGGGNDAANLVLMKNDPFHLTITNHQNALIKGMNPGDTKIFDWPAPPGFVYPP